jgi:pimeloyl-ACP methyl ester carboxylesterase
MYTVTSADGTRISYDRPGEGPAVILVNGALGYRKFKTMEQIAAALSERCTVINYDRRGGGDSGPAGPASVQRGSTISTR